MKSMNPHPLILLALIAASDISSAKENKLPNTPSNFGEDVAFLKKHAEVVVLRQGDAADPRPLAFSSYNGQQFGLYCQRMVRDRKYKYVWNATDIDECYDLENDPHELVNLAADPRHEALCRRYHQKVYEVFAALKDPLVLSRWNERWLRDGTPQIS